ncbi:uncharacterized protein LOC142223364 [Haematobia irritans]|uniref:uncharacterized protein LOC142223364 n=1 Tax=Haematobia irritans TaxID=7368 RepID=UPI003F50B12F
MILVANVLNSRKSLFLNNFINYQKSLSYSSFAVEGDTKVEDMDRYCMREEASTASELTKVEPMVIARVTEISAEDILDGSIEAADMTVVENLDGPTDPPDKSSSL